MPVPHFDTQPFGRCHVVFLYGEDDPDTPEDDRIECPIYEEFTFNDQTLDYSIKRAAPASLAVAGSFNQFDDKITAPLNGFAGVFDYYQRASCRGYLRQIETPTLIIHALDDPFMTPEVIPPEDAVSGQVCIEVSAGGGHVGFIDGGTPWRPSFYLPGRILRFLQPNAAMPGL